MTTFKLTFILVFFVGIQLCFSQTAQRSVLAAQGVSKTLSSGLYVSQSIGQQGITGNTGISIYTVQQGYQQNLQSVYSPIVVLNQITTDIFPKPFVDVVNFKFSEPIESEITVSLHSSMGNLIYQKKFPAPKLLLTVNFGELVPQNYIVKLTSTDYNHSSSLLKSR